MLEYKYISQSEYNEAINTPLPTKDMNYNNSLAPYFSEYVRRQLMELEDELNINIYEDGLNIKTTLDYNLQNILETTFNNTLKKNQRIFNNDLLDEKISLII